VILPSTFDPAVPIVAQCLSRANVYAFAREVRSYRAVKDFGRAALSIDCAVYCSALSAHDPRTQPGGDQTELLLSLREDKGSRLADHGLMPHPTLNRDISLRCPNLASFLRSIESVKLVITDRLHVAVAAVLLGKRLIYADPIDSKVSNYFSFTFRDEFADVVSERSIPWLAANGFAVPAVLAR
jgi:exopolysaccharide biosynthesis predicted pyruvyltransferase EpsI